MDFLKKLEALNKDAQKEAKLFYEKENKAAGTRLRKIMQEIKAVAQEIREDVSKKKSVE
jgi:hypothetical protein